MFLPEHKDLINKQVKVTKSFIYGLQIGTIGIIVNTSGFDWPIKKLIKVKFADKLGTYAFHLEDLTVNKNLELV